MTATGTVMFTKTDTFRHVAHLDGRDYPIDSLWAGDELTDIIIWARNISEPDAITVAHAYAVDHFGFDDDDDIVPLGRDVSRGWARWREATADEAIADEDEDGDGPYPRWDFSAQPADGFQPVTIVGGWD